MSALDGGRVNCLCCMKPLPIDNIHNRLRPVGYCDVICFAAGQLLSQEALKIWRQNAWKLDVNPMRPVT